MSSDRNSLSSADQSLIECLELAIKQYLTKGNCQFSIDSSGKMQAEKLIGAKKLKNIFSGQVGNEGVERAVTLYNALHALNEENQNPTRFEILQAVLNNIQGKGTELRFTCYLILETEKDLQFKKEDIDSNALRIALKRGASEIEHISQNDILQAKEEIWQARFGKSARIELKGTKQGK